MLVVRYTLFRIIKNAAFWEIPLLSHIYIFMRLWTYTKHFFSIFFIIQ